MFLDSICIEFCNSMQIELHSLFFKYESRLQNMQSVICHLQKCNPIFYTHTHKCEHTYRSINTHICVCKILEVFYKC